MIEDVWNLLEIVWNILEVALNALEEIFPALEESFPVVVILLPEVGGVFMLIFNPRRIFALRGVEKPSAFLARQGIAASTAIKFMRAQSSMFKIKYVEMICVTMNCTPNDLFEWKADAKTKLAENHPLKALERAEEIANIRELLHELPPEKLSRVASLVNELKNEE